MMFKFSCFQTHAQSHKHKKIAHLPAAAMPRIIDDSSEVPNIETSKSCVAEGRSYSDEVEIRPNIVVSKITHIKKSHSLGMGLDMKGKGSGGSASEDEMDQNFSSDGSHDICASFVQNEGKDSLIPVDDQFQDGHPSDSLHVFGDVGNHESVLSIGDAPPSDQGSQANFDGAQFSGEANSDSHAPGTPIFERSNSLPNSGSPGHFLVCSLRRIRSAEDLSVLLSKRKELFRHRSQALTIQNPGPIDALIDKNCSSNPVDGTYQDLDYNYFDSAKDWIIPLGDEVNAIDNHGEGSSFHQKDELPNKDFKVKRIEEWVTDLQNCGPLDESDGHAPLDGHTVLSDKIVLDVLPAKKSEGNLSPGMEVVKKYISSLSPSATHAQLVSYGLPVIPFLSAFSSLRALNLSGNAIARMTAGSLPRGLHILNLSKNKISTIEGLRELTRLRVLDLSYNRILRIGHGLASCSALKELYIAGNKIGEVEGLHRLLKLNVLDLRFNKISTTKGLGQLAANYNSLQAISLEGNPAQKNVGDDQMKKCLQGLLPHLTYFNRQSIKSGTLKDSADRSARLGISAHQMDRGPKATRKATHTAASSKVVSSSSHGRRSQAPSVSKSYKNRSARLPPSGTKPMAQQNPLHALNSLKSDFSIRRSRSEGTLGAV